MAVKNVSTLVGEFKDKYDNSKIKSSWRVFQGMDRDIILRQDRFYELFILWLKWQNYIVERDDDIGKLSKFIRKDIENNHFPEKITKYSVIEHLALHELDPTLTKAFACAREEYEIIVMEEFEDFSPIIHRKANLYKGET